MRFKLFLIIIQIVSFLLWHEPKDQNYSSLHSREGCMLLYGPKPRAMGGARNLKGGGSPVPSYEIVVHSSKYTSQSLSLFRTSDKGNLSSIL